ncbi:helix-turn-helix transcriptional regulator [Myroides guanonis]|uniref:DNA-binding transcriptional regulator, XRE-family HTH domain n=1 Tax=Myroides guanonis TaxID=1150112 RepID=A0A1I3PP08_9FLAO|nr:helix-turn-helix transcriptional regulator [Myroides guanonis]SFJ23139.1 DNA-binding transcriptional regulator, XRE-family HTH domain [Myroides guanonis]
MIKNRLKKIIENTGLSSTMLAILLEVHETTISQWKSNRQQPSMINIVKLMRLLELRYDEIIIEDSPLVKKGTIQKLQVEYDKIRKELAPEISQLRKEEGNPKLIHPKVIIAIKKYEKELIGDDSSS